MNRADTPSEVSIGYTYKFTRLSLSLDQNQGDS